MIDYNMNIESSSSSEDNDEVPDDSAIYSEQHLRLKLTEIKSIKIKLEEDSKDVACGDPNQC